MCVRKSTRRSTDIDEIDISFQRHSYLTRFLSLRFLPTRCIFRSRFCNLELHAIPQIFTGTAFTRTGEFPSRIYTPPLTGTSLDGIYPSIGGIDYEKQSCSAASLSNCSELLLMHHKVAAGQRGTHRFLKVISDSQERLPTAP